MNADDTSVIEIKTATDTSLKAKRNYIFARLCNEKYPFLYYKNDCKLIPYSLDKVILMRRLKNPHFFLFKVHADTSLIEFKIP